MSTSAGTVGTSSPKHHTSGIANEQTLTEEGKIILTDKDIAPSPKDTMFWQGWWMGATEMVSGQATQTEAAQTSGSN